MPRVEPEITVLLREWSSGADKALDQLMPLVFDDLHRMASRYLRKEHCGHILQSTALVNEVLLDLLRRDSLEWKDRRHFFGFIANQMRRTLVDHARKRLTAKRGDGIEPTSLDEAMSAADGRRLDLVALDDALKDLAGLDPEAQRVVELKFFVGLTLKEIADIEETSVMTVRRRWDKAKIWLYRELADGSGKLSSSGPGGRSQTESRTR